MINGAQSIYRVLNILKRIIINEYDVLTAKRLSNEFDIPIATTHRLITVLKELDFIKLDNETKGYILSLDGALFSGKTKNQYILSRYTNLATFIANEFGYPVSLYVRAGNDAVCLVTIKGSDTVQIVNNYPGDILPLGRGACTLGILSFLPEEEIDRIMEANWPIIKDQVRCSKDDIYQFIRRSQKNGYGFGQGILVKGTLAIAFPLRFQEKVIGAMGVDVIINESWAKRRKELIKFALKRIK